MSFNENVVAVRVKGDFALFTRPEAKAERLSYPVMTPSAARGILEAIFWHPEFVWRVREIHVFAPVKTFCIKRNEVSSKIPVSPRNRYNADEDRTQRNSVLLREVDYAIFAEVELKPGVTSHPKKYREQFLRRVERGQCYHRPALGCREFAADFMPYAGDPAPISWTEDLGLMLWDMDYASCKPPFFPLLFDAKVENGILHIPAEPIWRK